MESTELKNHEISIPVIKAYRIALALLPLIIFLFGVPYMVFWLDPFTHHLNHFLYAIFHEGRVGIITPYLVRATIAIFVGILLHELLHGLGWIPFAKSRFRSLQFGFMTPEMAPYAHCKEPLPVYGYRIGIILPGLLLGFIPALKGIITGSFSWLCYGIFFTWAASGDFIMFWMIRHLKGNTRILDHPGKLGCIVI